MKDTLLEKAKVLIETTKDDKAYICPVTVREVVSGLVDLIEPDTELLAAKEAVILAAQGVVMADVYKYPFLSRADAVKQGVDRLHDAVKRLAFIQIHGEAAIAKHSGRG